MNESIYTAIDFPNVIAILTLADTLFFTLRLKSLAFVCKVGVFAVKPVGALPVFFLPNASLLCLPIFAALPIFFRHR